MVLATVVKSKSMVLYSRAVVLPIWQPMKNYCQGVIEDRKLCYLHSQIKDNLHKLLVVLYRKRGIETREGAWLSQAVILIR